MRLFKRLNSFIDYEYLTNKERITYFIFNYYDRIYYSINLETRLK